MPPIETVNHGGPVWSLVVVFGVNLGLLLSLALLFLIAGRRSEGDERGAYHELARWTCIACLALQLLSASYYARLLAGSSEQGTVTQVERFPNAKSPHCDLTLETAHGTMKIAAPHGQCHNLPLGTKVPIITVANSTWFAQLGERATVTVASALFGGLSFGLLLIAGVVLRGVGSRTPEVPQS